MTKRKYTWYLQGVSKYFLITLLTWLILFQSVNVGNVVMKLHCPVCTDEYPAPEQTLSVVLCRSAVAGQSDLHQPVHKLAAHETLIVHILALPKNTYLISNFRTL